MALQLGTVALWSFALLVLLPAVQAYIGECPPFKCTLPYANKANGDWYNGMFVDRDAPYDPANDDDDGRVAYYYFDPNDFPDSFPEITGGTLNNAQMACAQACTLRWNLEGGQPKAQYWMFEQTCDWGVGGQCTCLGEDTCTGPYWSDDWYIPERFGQFPRTSAEYSTGKLCDTSGHGDPHFQGADGSHFDFSGVPNRAYSLISDSHVQVNAFLGGRMAKWDNRVKALTWMRKISIMWGHHVAVLAARPGADGDYMTGYLDSIMVDGEPLLPRAHETVSAVNGDFSVTWEGVRIKNGRDWVDELVVEVKNVLSLRLTVRPEVRNLRTHGDAVIHFTLKLQNANLSLNAHGVLGQTYRPDFVGRLAKQELVFSKLLNTMVVPGDNADGFIDGVPEDYEVKDLERADCNLCRFARGTMVDEETTRAMAMSSVVTSSMATARKLLSWTQEH